MAEMTTANIANAILQDLIDHAKDFSAESALAGRMADAGCWRTVADALVSLRKTHRLVPVEVAEAVLPEVEDRISTAKWVKENTVSTAYYEGTRSPGLEQWWSDNQKRKITNWKALATSLRGGDSHAK
jgi:hypothetical protein